VIEGKNIRGVLTAEAVEEGTAPVTALDETMDLPDIDVSEEDFEDAETEELNEDEAPAQ
jgi:hypothetical protein